MIIFFFSLGYSYTGRLCECGGKLQDFLLDWHDALPEDNLVKSEEECEKADLSICLGTSLRVNPANELPVKTLENGGKLAIINLQKTGIDEKATVKINAEVDVVMKRVMKELGLEVRSFEEKKMKFEERKRKREEVKEMQKRKRKKEEYNGCNKE